jgi:hypothetical protein
MLDSRLFFMPGTTYISAMELWIMFDEPIGINRQRVKFI